MPLGNSKDWALIEYTTSDRRFWKLTEQLRRSAVKIRAIILKALDVILGSSSRGIFGDIISGGRILDGPGGRERLAVSKQCSTGLPKPCSTV